MSADMKRYELFGWDYEHFNPVGEREISWYRRFAERTGGPVLELACGTGRLAVALAVAGYEIHGLDLSQAMLVLARCNAARTAPEVRRHIHWHHGDMANFCLILVAGHSFREFASRDQPRSRLRCARRHLRPAGRLLVTERRFDPGLYADVVIGANRSVTRRLGTR